MSLSRSIGYKSITISDKHINSHGDIQLVCKMNLLKDDSANHSLSSDLKNLINDEKSSDLTIEAGGKKFNVHRNILMARSPVLADLIKKKEENNGIELKDMKADTLRELLTYIYTDSSINVDEMANALLVAADSYQLLGLKTHCEKHLGEVIKPTNASSMLILADQYKCRQLKKSVLSYCKDNHTYIMKDEQWKTIEEEKPDLFEEAVSEVMAKTDCNSHTECLKKKGKRYEIEKNSSTKDIE